MQTRAISLFLILAAFISLAPSAEAGPWPKKRKTAFYKLGFGFLQANRFYEPDGRIISIPTLSDYTVSFYGEYGITDRITAIAYIPFVQRLTLNRQLGTETGFVFFEGAEQTSLADFDIGARFGLFQKGNTVVSAGLMLGIPTGNTTQPNGLFTGDGEFNQHISLGIGHSFYPAPAYVSAEVGFNNRSSGFSDEFRFAAEAGYTVASKLTFSLKLRGVEPLRNGDDAVTGGTGGLYANNQRYLAYGGELSYKFTQKLGLSFSVEGATRGQNILSAPAYQTGLFLDM
ncbi:MAG: transporter [Bacteroidota bacterium]